MKISIGTSHLQNRQSYHAGQEAAEKAIQALGKSPNFLFIFDTPDHDHFQMLEGIKSIAGTVTSAGFPAGGVIEYSSIYTSKTVAVMAFYFENARIFVEYNTGAAGASKETAEYLSKKILSRLMRDDSDGYFPILFLFGDNRINNGKIIHNLSDTLSPLCPIIGAGVNGLEFCGPYADYQIRDYSAVSVLFQSKSKAGVGVAHGWYPHGKSVVATRTDDNRIYELNGRLAFDVYKEMWSDIFPDIKNKSFNEIQHIFYNFAVHHPIGLAQLMGEYLIRDPYEVKEDGSILCGGDVPENSVLHFMSGDNNSLIIGTKNATRNALQSVAKKDLIGSLYFDCITRHSLPGYNFQREIFSIRQGLGSDIPIIGVLTHGEIATPETGPVLLHNKAIAISVFSG